jgi:hypothetical protein
MLGEKLGEFQGQGTGQRILPADDAHPKVGALYLYRT